MRDTGAPKHHGFMLDLIERKIRLRAQQFYEEHGHVDGHPLDDWLKAESEVLQTSILAPLWRFQHPDHAPAEWSGPASYDSGYEHSFEHWIELQHLVHEADTIFTPSAAT